MVQTVAYPNISQSLQIRKATKQNIIENMVYIDAITNPLCITNQAITAVLIYTNLPCHNNKTAKCLNFSIEKSLAKAAYFPSLLIIPTPTSAAQIIATSFPPSSIDSSVFQVCSLINSDTNAFYVGKHLQYTTARALQAIWKNAVC
ncbi:unnamed protein product [Paramecium sonneborni]|uniref:Uncharacterized protein n=1 Tax=Paramecium sonneborni TaxID=65129 RepID=A0A8S1RTR8_9CILI|nr:unnamed protein product [Paramecium sonneborni]